MKKLTFILAVLSFTACKKNNTTQQTTPTPTPVNISPMADTTKFFYAKFITLTTQNIYILPTTVSNTYYASASFSSVLQQLNGWYTACYVNLVKVNNAQLTLSNNYIDYTNNLYANDSTANWHISGKDNIPSFDFTNSGKMPSYNYLLIPDSINRSQDFILPVNPGRTKTLEVYFLHGGNSYTFDTICTITNSQSAVTIPSAKLHYIATGYSQLIITQSNYSPQSVNGLPMCFISQYQTIKEIFFK